MIQQGFSSRFFPKSRQAKLLEFIWFWYHARRELKEGEEGKIKIKKKKREWWTLLLFPSASPLFERPIVLRAFSFRLSSPHPP